jgi:hypothetical protein
MNVKGLIFLFGALFFALTAGAQTQGIVSTAASCNIKGNSALSWIIGQPVASATTAADKSVILTQGLQEKMVVTTIIENSFIPGKLRLYPNPTGDILNISFDEAVPGETGIVIVDSKGNPVKSDIMEAAMTEKQLDLKNIPSGIYYIRLSGGKNVNVFKVVKL